MFKSDRYIITPFIENSFDSTIKGLIEYFVSDYLISEDEKYTVSYDSKCIIDNTTVGSGSNFSNMKRPDKINVTANFMNNGSWTNCGSGLVYCTILFFERRGTEKIDIRWSVGAGGVYNYEEISIKQFRKLKLEKLNKIK